MIETAEKAGHAARRRTIAEAALHLAAAEGWPAVTLRRLAASLGCSAPAIYQYFRDKESLLATLATQGSRRLAAVITEAAAEGGPARRLRAVARAWWDFAAANPELYQVTFGLGVPVPPVRPADVMLALREAAGALAARKGVDADATALAGQLALLCHGAVALSLPQPEFAGRERLDEAVEVWLRGLKG